MSVTIDTYKCYNPIYNVDAYAGVVTAFNNAGTPSAHPIYSYEGYINCFSPQLIPITDIETVMSGGSSTTSYPEASIAADIINNGVNNELQTPLTNSRSRSVIVLKNDTSVAHFVYRRAYSGARQPGAYGMLFIFTNGVLLSFMSIGLNIHSDISTSYLNNPEYVYWIYSKIGTNPNAWSLGLLTWDNSNSWWTLVTSNNLSIFFEAVDTAPEPHPDPIMYTDPYKQGGFSDKGGGTGDFDGTSDSIDFPSLPTLSAVDAGFITLFNPSVAQLNSLASYMWSNPLFDINAWKKIFADPMDAILGLSIVPVAVPSGSTKEVTVGNIPTGVYLTTASSQYAVVDCGTLNVNEYWGAYLDYEPYTKAEIYLPYIGIHPIAVDDIMGRAVHVKYHIDILSGACCAMVKCGDSIMYSFIGQCSSSIPITGDNWTNVINGAISIAGSIGSMVASSKMTGISNISDQAKKIENATNIMRGSSGIASTLVNQMKPSIERSGAMGGTGGMLGVQTPFLILTRPRQALPERQNEYIGYPSFITMKLGDLSGYTEVESIHIENVPATDTELSEIEAILKSGVIF